MEAEFVPLCNSVHLSQKSKKKAISCQKKLIFVTLIYKNTFAQNDINEINSKFY